MVMFTQSAHTEAFVSKWLICVYRRHGNNIAVLAEDGTEGDRDGAGPASLFKQVTGLVAEFDHNMFSSSSRQCSPGRPSVLFTIL